MRTHALVVGACLVFACGVARAAEIKWAKSFDAAMAEAKSGKKLVMADFYTDW